MSLNQIHDLNPSLNQFQTQTKTQLPTPIDTPQTMDQDEPSPRTSHAHHSSTWTPVDGLTPISTNPSRKRSRDDTSYDPEADGSYFPSAVEQVNTPATIPEEPIYGEGMVLLNPRTGLSISAESQSGTWVEEQADRAQLEEEIKKANFRPTAPTSRKTVRLSPNSTHTETAPTLVDTSLHFGAPPASPPKSAAIPPEPDGAAITLGVSWTQVGTDEAIQSAARGWARYIDNHYARCIHGAEIVLKNTAHDAYLVRCHEGFFLFSESLLEGQLVALTWERCLENLKSYPFVFDGQERLYAERTPGPDVKTAPSNLPAELPAQHSSTQQINNWANQNTVSHVVTSVAGAESPTEIVSAATNGHMDID